MKLTVEVDENLLHDAQAVYETIGIDTETAIRMFLKRTVLEQRLPLNTGVPTTENGASTPSPNVMPKRTKNAITQLMVEDIWRRFRRYLDEGESINSLAADAHTTTGMNQGSAFIYLTILDNLVNGKHNTRNMKMADLEYYMGQIKDELDEQDYRNAIQSLRLSIPYWDKEEFGQFAAKVGVFLDTLDPDETDESNRANGNDCAANSETLAISLSPSDSKEFGRLFQKNGHAIIRVFYTDGTHIDKEWNKRNFKQSSNVIGNLRSRPEFRQGEWQKRGISHIEVFVPEDMNQ